MCSPRWRTSLCHWRGEMRRMQIIDTNSELLDDSQRIDTIVVFFTSLIAFRKHLHRTPFCSSFVAAINIIRNAILAWLATSLEWYTFHVYSTRHDVHKPPPSRKRTHLPLKVDPRDTCADLLLMRDLLSTRSTSRRATFKKESGDQLFTGSISSGIHFNAIYF